MMSILPMDALTMWLYHHGPIASKLDWEAVSGFSVRLYLWEAVSGSRKSAQWRDCVSPPASTFPTKSRLANSQGLLRKLTLNRNKNVSRLGWHTLLAPISCGTNSGQIQLQWHNLHKQNISTHLLRLRIWAYFEGISGASRAQSGYI